MKLQQLPADTAINVISLVILHMEGILMTRWLLISWLKTTDTERKGKGQL